MRLLAFSTACITSLASAQQVVSDSGQSGPALELVHMYFDQWPTGISVSSTGRQFSNYPAGLDKNNTNDGSNGRYQVAELTSNTTEKAYPNAHINNPPGGAINRTTSPPTTKNYVDYLLSVQSVVVDSADRLWILDTGRAVDPHSGMLTSAVEGGPKLIGVSLANDSFIRTITFPPTVAYADSYLNDVRFDLRPNLSGGTNASSEGVAYITDSSTEGRNGIIVVDLSSGKSWRHLDGNPKVHPLDQVVPFVWGEPVYAVPTPGMPHTYLPFGSDGIALGADGKDLYFSAIAGRYLYSVPTANLRANDENSEVLCQSAIQTRGEKGVTDGMETDSNGFIYAGNAEQEGISLFNPKNGTVRTYVRDPRVNWIDTMSVATDGNLYFTSNQLQATPLTYPGTDRRVKPFALFRAPLPKNGTKINPGKEMS